MKATVLGTFKRVGGWCEPIRDKTFPLSEYSVKIEGWYPLAYRRVVAFCGNLGGNTENFVPCSGRKPCRSWGFFTFYLII